MERGGYDFMKRKNEYYIFKKRAQSPLYCLVIHFTCKTEFLNFSTRVNAS